VRAKSVSLRLGFGGDDFSYAIDFGLPVGGGQSAFALDPEIKRESIWNGPLLRPAAVLCERDNGIVRIRGDRRTWSEPYQIRPYDSMLSEFADPRQAPEVLRVREQIRSWRFYDHRPKSFGFLGSSPHWCFALTGVARPGNFRHAALGPAGGLP
jgi:predicted ATPase